jgi:crotonobetainyl-CoA hydratase
MAGGAALVTACDLALAAETATFGYPGIARGLVAPAVVARLARAVGERPARQLLLTGQSIAAARALELGLVSEVVPAADLLARARAWARRLAEHPRAALLDTKRLLNTLRAAPPQAATLPGQAVVHRPDKMK